MSDSRLLPDLSSETPRRTVLATAAGLVLAWLTPIHALSQDPKDARPAEGLARNDSKKADGGRGAEEVAP